MAQRKLEIVIAGDSRGAEKAFDRVEKSGKSLSQKLSSAGNKMTVGMTLPLIAVGKKAFDAASDLGEAQNKANVVFGKSGKAIAAFGKNAAKNFGLSERAALDAASGFGALFKAMGTAEEQSAAFSQQLVILAADLASFNNVDPEEALLALKSGLVGEAEPLRKFGVQLSAARVEAEAFALGLARPTANLIQIQKAQLDVEDSTVALTKAVKEHGRDSQEAERARNNLAIAEERLKKAMAGQRPELDANMKAQAAFSIIMRDTAVAQGDFANTADSAANKQRILKAEVENASAALGEKLLPIGLQVIGMLQGVTAGFTGLTDQQQNIALWSAGVVLALGPVTKALQGLTIALVGSGGSGGLVGAFKALARHPIALLFIAIGTAAVFAYNKVKSFKDGMDAIGRAFKDAWEDSLNGLDMTMRGIANVWEDATGAVRQFIAWVDTALDKLRQLKDALPGGNLPDEFNPFKPEGRANLFHDGGVVPGAKGQQVPALLMAGETVLPTHKHGAVGGVVVNVQTNANPYQIGREVMWQLGRV